MEYKTYIVEQVDEKNIYVVDDENHYLCLLKNDLCIKENDQVIVQNNKIIKVLPYDKKLYQEIKKLENKIFK